MKARLPRDSDSDSAESEVPRHFQGAAALQLLLQKSGTLADVEDVAEAFRAASKDEVPAAVVIQALWEDEPRFASTADASALFGNLLGLYDLIAQGESPDLSVPAVRALAKRPRAPRPTPFGAGGPSDDDVEAAWRYLDDHPRENERAQHAFENRQDALLSWLDACGLSDDAFALARHTLFDVFAMLEMGGLPVRSLDPTHLSAVGSVPAPAELPSSLAAWIDEAVFEAEQHEVRPLSHEEAERARALIVSAAAALWRGAAAR